MRDHDTKIDAGIINTFLEYFIEKRDVDSVFSIFDVIPKQSDIGINRYLACPLARHAPAFLNSFHLGIRFCTSFGIKSTYEMLRTFS